MANCYMFSCHRQKPKAPGKDKLFLTVRKTLLNKKPHVFWKTTLDQCQNIFLFLYLPIFYVMF